MDYRKKLENELSKQICPECKSGKIGIDNYGLFNGQDDWFYFCKECNLIFGRTYDDWVIKKMNDRLRQMFKENVHVKVNK